MVPLFEFLMMLFGGIGAAKVVRSLGTTTGVAAMGAEITLHKSNALQGKNPLLDDHCAAVEEKICSAAGLPHIRPTKNFTLFKITEEGVLAEEQKMLARAWLLTQGEVDELNIAMQRDALARKSPVAEELEKIQEKLSPEDADYLEQVASPKRGSFRRLMTISDNRLMNPLTVLMYRNALAATISQRTVPESVKKEELEKAITDLEAAVAEAHARQNAVT
jgi:hypothetical protein